ncbi:hypothetical protein Purlil1_2546 [Purpureocillium lilacinum]|uniref:Uncharacterized protein n=1 Tax=Purpureocillium lilacinum TaxID=33203 RepID=A0ABR0CAH2_PURLI|nr:hypothetical protein Purlil1_2546 [Purpureocillium lilacinum]
MSPRTREFASQLGCSFKGRPSAMGGMRERGSNTSRPGQPELPVWAWMDPGSHRRTLTSPGGPAGRCGGGLRLGDTGNLRHARPPTQLALEAPARTGPVPQRSAPAGCRTPARTSPSARALPPSLPAGAVKPMPLHAAISDELPSTTWCTHGARMVYTRCARPSDSPPNPDPFT